MQRARNEAVIAGVMHRRKKHAVEAELSAHFIELVLVATAARTLDDSGYNLRRMLSNRKVVPWIHYAILCMVPLYDIGSSLTPKFVPASSASRFI